MYNSIIVINILLFTAVCDIIAIVLHVYSVMYDQNCIIILKSCSKKNC